MNFLELYGEQLDHELGSADRTQLFTTARRKSAVNVAMNRFAIQARATERLGTISLSDAVSEYDVEATLTDWIRPLGDPSIKIVEAGVPDRYIEGKNLTRMDPPSLNRFEDGWRATTAQTPKQWYFRKEGGRTFLGFYPAPDVLAGETWSALVPYLAKPTQMTADGDEPFTVGANVMLTLEPYHQALVHYAASRLELLRKNYTRSKEQLTMYSGFVAEFLSNNSEDVDNTIQFAHDYLAAASRSSRAQDPRRWP